MRTYTNKYAVTYRDVFMNVICASMNCQ